MTSAKRSCHAGNSSQASARIVASAAAGLEFDHEPVVDGDVIAVGDVSFTVLATPGHTPGSVSYYTDGMLFSGDTLFRASIGRTDMPGGSFEQEMESIWNKLLVLPDETVVLPGHMDETQIAFEKKHNPFVLEWMRRGTDSPPWPRQ